jgi:hypothetical protein
MGSLTSHNPIGPIQIVHIKMSDYFRNPNDATYTFYVYIFFYYVICSPFVVKMLRDETVTMKRDKKYLTAKLIALCYFKLAS